MNIFNQFARWLVRIKNEFFADEVSLGRGTYLNVGCEVRGNVTVGDFCAIGRGVVFQGRNHITNRPSLQNIFYDTVLDENLGYEDEKGIRVGSDVWIGNRVMIMPGVEVGHGAILAAGAVVTRDVEPYEIVGGVPAEHIDWRFDERIREELLQLAWWEWPEERLRRNQQFFEKDLTSLRGDVELRDLIE